MVQVWDQFFMVGCFCWGDLCFIPSLIYLGYSRRRQPVLTAKKSTAPGVRSDEVVRNGPRLSEIVGEV